MYSLLITEIAKFNIGRLRPHFITLLIEKCSFTLTDDICKVNGFTKMVNLTEVLENCPDPLPDDVADGMKSFSSGMILKIDTLHCSRYASQANFPLSDVSIFSEANPYLFNVGYATKLERANTIWDVRFMERTNFDFCDISYVKVGL